MAIEDPPPPRRRRRRRCRGASLIGAGLAWASTPASPISVAPRASGARIPLYEKLGLDFCRDGQPRAGSPADPPSPGGSTGTASSSTAHTVPHRASPCLRALGGWHEARRLRPHLQRRRPVPEAGFDGRARPRDPPLHPPRPVRGRLPGHRPRRPLPRPSSTPRPCAPRSRSPLRQRAGASTPQHPDVRRRRSGRPAPRQEARLEPGSRLARRAHRGGGVRRRHGHPLRAHLLPAAPEKGATLVGSTCASPRSRREGSRWRWGRWRRSRGSRRWCRDEGEGHGPRAGPQATSGPTKAPSPLAALAGVGEVVVGPGALPSCTGTSTRPSWTRRGASRARR